MQVVKGYNRQKLTIDEKRHLLRAGGEGRVFEISQQPDLVAKLYHRPKERQEKVKSMLQNPPDDSATPGHVSIAWPIDSLYSADSDHAFIGFLMKKIGEAKSFHEFARTSTRKNKHPHFNFKYLLTAAANLAGVFAALHKRSYVVGDVNESNILINDEALVTIIDTDSFQVPALASNFVYRCTVGRTEFTPPELQSLDFSKVDREEQHDLFGMAVLIFQLLMLGYHPFNGSPVFSGDDWPIGKRIAKGNFPFGSEKKPFKPGLGFPSLNILDPGIQRLFLRCFEDGKNDPLCRPSAQEWKDTLINAIKQLVVCQKVPMHYFGKHLKICPWCERAKNKYTPDPFPLPLDIGTQTRLPSVDSAFKKMQIEQERLRLVMERQRLDEELKRQAELRRIEEERKRIEEEFVRNAEIHPGTWSIEPKSPELLQTIGAYGNLAVFGKLVLRLSANNTFQGRSEQSFMIASMTYTMEGNWFYDSKQRILVLQGTITASMSYGGLFSTPQFPSPYNMQYRITGGGAGRFLAIDSERGLQWAICQV